MSNERVLADFTGRWALKRTISHADGTQAQMEGVATFTPTLDGSDYEEVGQLKIGAGAPITATRRYRWGPDLSVYFEDGRLFHQVPPSGGTARHWCDPDTYIAEYDFARWPRFRVNWQVHGPRKDYQMVSDYVPISSISAIRDAALGQ